MTERPVVSGYNWYVKHPVLDMRRRMTTWAWKAYRTAQRNARNRKIEFLLTKPQMTALIEEAGGKCMVSGISFTDEPVKGASRRPWIPSLDRIKSDGPYSKGNCRLVCCAVNLAMNEWGLPTLKRLAKAITNKELA